MINNFITVFLQVVSLFLMMSFGFFGQRFKMITEQGSQVITDITMFFVTPCLIINSFIREFDSAKLKELFIVLVAAILIHAASILLVNIIFKGNKNAVNCVLRFGIVFSNVGYMGIPLQEAVLGDDGVFFGAAYVAVFQLVLWSYGIVCMSGDRKYLSAKRLIINPGIIGTVIGLIVFVTSLQIPYVFRNVISCMASLNTPLAMIVVGFFLAKSDILAAFRAKRTYIAAAFRLIVIPLLTLGALYIVGLKGTVSLSIIISSSAPIAAATSMFASKFKKDTACASNLVAITTVLSIITMPFIVALAQIIFN